VSGQRQHWYTVERHFSQVRTVDKAARFIITSALLAALAAVTAPAAAVPGHGGPPSELPGSGNGPPEGWVPGNGNGNPGGSSGNGAGADWPVDGPSAVPPDVHTVPEPSTLLLALSALGVLLRLSGRGRHSADRT